MPAVRSLSSTPATAFDSRPVRYSRSCSECRRLKRKCDKTYPCNICTKLNKTCTYSDRDTAQRHVAGLTAQVKELERRLEARSTTTPVPFLAQPRPSNAEVSSSRNQETAIPSAASDFLERQPSRALGYEWTEFETSNTRRYDGTASLTDIPDGSGYLGFASGATLLRVLQSCAGKPIQLLPNLDEVVPVGANWALNPDETSGYVDAYFHTFHRQYPFVHEPTFRAQWSEVVPRPPAYQWDFLFNVILAMGAFCSTDARHAVDRLLNRVTQSLTSYHFETGSLVLVQAFGLLANLAQKRGRPNTGFMYIGTAMRMAISLGFHRELPLWHISPFEKEVRRRVWWWLVLADSGASMTFGRPFLLPVTGSDVRMINNVNDMTFTPTAQTLPTPVKESTLYSSLIRQVILQGTVSPIYSRVIANPPPSYSEILSIDRELERWNSNLSPEIPVHDDPQDISDYILQWRQGNIRIIMYRRAFLERALKGLSLMESEPVELETPVDLQCSHNCLQAAGKTIDSIRIFFASCTPNPSDSWYSLHYLFQAIFVILIALHTDRTSFHSSRWTECVETTRSLLESMYSDALAQKCLAIINDLVPRSSPQSFDDTLFAEILQNNPEWLFDLRGPGILTDDGLPSLTELNDLSNLWAAGTN